MYSVQSSYRLQCQTKNLWHINNLNQKSIEKKKEVYQKGSELSVKELVKSSEHNYRLEDNNGTRAHVIEPISQEVITRRRVQRQDYTKASITSIT
jgi:hypothetical protein